MYEASFVKHEHFYRLQNAPAIQNLTDLIKRMRDSKSAVVNLCSKKDIHIERGVRFAFPGLSSACVANGMVTTQFIKSLDFSKFHELWSCLKSDLFVETFSTRSFAQLQDFLNLLSVLEDPAHAVTRQELEALGSTVSILIESIQGEEFRWLVSGSIVDELKVLLDLMKSSGIFSEQVV